MYILLTCNFWPFYSDLVSIPVGYKYMFVLAIYK
jgi:hypothetical protein